MKIDVSSEIFFKTARSSGAGGQHINKVETLVEGYFAVIKSRMLTSEQKQTVLARLQAKIDEQGYLRAKSQTHRSQLANKQEVVDKINQLLEGALKKVKKRVATKPTARSRQQRIDDKKRRADIKQARRKPLDES